METLESALQRKIRECDSAFAKNKSLSNSIKSLTRENEIIRRALAEIEHGQRRPEKAARDALDAAYGSSRYPSEC